MLDLSWEVLIAVGGTVAVAIGFALKDFVASIVAGLVILVDRPFQVGDRVSFDGYYGEGPYLDEIVFKIVPETTALGIQLRAGEIHGCDDAEISQLAVLDGVPNLRVYQTPSLSYMHVTFNCVHPILSDVRVRQALALAVDRQAIADHVFDGVAEAALALELARHVRRRFGGAHVDEVRAAVEAHRARITNLLGRDE